MPLMRPRDGAGRRREVFSDATGAATSRLTTPARSSQRNRSDRSDDISRFIEAALRRPSSLRKMIHSRMSSVSPGADRESVSLIPAMRGTVRCRVAVVAHGEQE